MTLVDTTFYTKLNYQSFPKPAFQLKIIKADFETINFDEEGSDIKYMLMGYLQEFLEEYMQNGSRFLFDQLEKFVYFKYERIFSLFKIKDMQIKYKNDYINLAMKPIFSPDGDNLN